MTQKLKQGNETPNMLHKKTILVVDDDSNWLHVYKLIFEEEGFDVLTANSGEEALTEYTKRKPDFILTDFRMMGINGIELIENIRQSDKSTPILMMSAYADVSMVIKAFQLGADDFLDKLRLKEELVSRVKELLNETALKRENARLKRLITDLTKENEDLGLQLAAKQANEHTAGMTHIDNAQFKAFCGAIIHGLKGEFLHIGDAAKSLQQSPVTPLDVQDECSLIERSVEYSQLLLRRLIDYLEIGKPKIEKSSIVELMKRIESLVVPRLPSSVQLKVKIDKNAKEQTVHTDVEQLVGVLLELISNASNVLKDKGGLLELSVKHQADKVLMSVRDNGPGVSESIKKVLFKQQVSSKKGLGLGLYLSGQNIAAMGGELRLESSSNKGTKFTVLLPADTTKGS